MKSISVFMENLAGDLATDAYLTSNKFDGVEQAQTSNKFNPQEVVPKYPEVPKPNPQDPSVHHQQPKETTMGKKPSTVDDNVLDGHKGIAKKYRAAGTTQAGQIVGRLYTHKHDAQAPATGDNLAKRLKK